MKQNMGFIKEKMKNIFGERVRLLPVAAGIILCLFFTSDCIGWVYHDKDIKIINHTNTDIILEHDPKCDNNAEFVSVPEKLSKYPKDQAGMIKVKLRWTANSSDNDDRIIFNVLDSSREKIGRLIINGVYAGLGGVNVKIIYEAQNNTAHKFYLILSKWQDFTNIEINQGVSPKKAAAPVINSQDDQYTISIHEY